MRLSIGEALVNATGYNNSLECNFLRSAFEHILIDAIFYCWMTKSTNYIISVDFSTLLNSPRRTKIKINNDKTPAAYVILIPDPPTRGKK